MPVMFIPAAAGLINSWAVIRPSLVQYIFITFFTTFLVMGAAGISTQYVIRRGKAKNNQVKQVVTKGKESAE
jgi:holin-like protein